MRLTKTLATTVAAFGLIASSTAMAAAPVAPVSTPTEARASAQAGGSALRGSRPVPAATWIIALLAALAAAAAIAAISNGNTQPESP